MPMPMPTHHRLWHCCSHLPEPPPRERQAPCASFWCVDFWTFGFWTSIDRRLPGRDGTNWTNRSSRYRRLPMPTQTRFHLRLRLHVFLFSKPTPKATLARPVRPMPQPQRPTARCANWRCPAHRRRRQRRRVRPMGPPRSRAAKVSPTRTNLARRCCCWHHQRDEEGTRTWLSSVSFRRCDFNRIESIVQSKQKSFRALHRTLNAYL